MSLNFSNSSNLGWHFFSGTRGGSSSTPTTPWRRRKREGRPMLWRQRYGNDAMTTTQARRKTDARWTFVSASPLSTGTKISKSLKQISSLWRFKGVLLLQATIHYCMYCLGDNCFYRIEMYANSYILLCRNKYWATFIFASNNKHICRY